MSIKGYKVFNPDWTCRGFQYEVGKTFIHEGNIEVCDRGFHFCQKAVDCFNYYNFDSKNKVAEVIAGGNVETEGNKSVTDKITIVRELTWHEVLDLVNSGKDCTGLGNTGYRNTGDWNTGNRNTGDWNTGNRNTGDCNTGDWNTGNRNTGDWNKTNYSTGLFNTREQNIYIFNKPSNWTLNDWFDSKVRNILNRNFELTVWIYEEDMTEEEKVKYPSYKTTGGYMKEFTFEEACKNMWDNLTDEEKNTVIAELPNFDADIFKEITGIDINK